MPDPLSKIHLAHRGMACGPWRGSRAATAIVAGLPQQVSVLDEDVAVPILPERLLDTDSERRSERRRGILRRPGPDPYHQLAANAPNHSLSLAFRTSLHAAREECFRRLPRLLPSQDSLTFQLLIQVG
jgi:hypothetical protein